MPRPKCCRQIGAMPQRSCFQPEGMTSAPGEEVLLTLDEYEALRLADLEGLYQEQAAFRMNISRQTFGRIIEAAHRKLADVIVHGKALRIDGGAVSLGGTKDFQCPRCHRALGSPCDKRSGEGCPHCRKHAQQ